MRETVQTEHAEDGAERREEDSQLERDRNVSRPGEVRFAADDERVLGGVHPALQPEPTVAPRSAMPRTIEGSGERRSPMARSRPWTGNGVWASHRVKPASRTRSHA